MGVPLTSPFLLSSHSECTGLCSLPWPGLAADLGAAPGALQASGTAGGTRHICIGTSALAHTTSGAHSHGPQHRLALALQRHLSAEDEDVCSVSHCSTGDKFGPDSPILAYDLLLVSAEP